MNQEAHEITLAYSFFHQTVQTIERMTCCSPFYESRWWVWWKWWKFGVVSLRLCAMSLFSVPAWASIPGAKGAVCRTCSSKRHPAWHPKLHCPLDCASLGMTCELIHTQPETGNLSKEQTAWQRSQAQREGSCSLQQGRSKRHTMTPGARGWCLLCCLHQYSYVLPLAQVRF